MSMEHIRKFYGVPAKRGGRVKFGSIEKSVLGTIVGSRGQYLRIRWDGDGFTTTNHPTWMIKYL